MNSNLTELVFVVDRSGSMSESASEAEGGIKQFIEEQKQTVGEANITIVEFSSNVSLYCDNVPLKDFKGYFLSPLGMTKLLDGLGFAINHVGNRLMNTKEEDRPALVLFTVVTDGAENNSKEYTYEQIQKLIKQQEDIYSWKFGFLCAGLEATQNATNLNINSNKVSSVDFKDIKVGYQAFSKSAHKCRSALAAGLSNRDIDYNSQG